MNEKEQILLDNFNEYFNSGKEEFEKQRFNTATTLFFKAIIALCDLYLLKKERMLPSSHTNRFQLLQEKSPFLYNIIDATFPFYQASYNKKIDKETVNILKENAERIKKMLGI